MGVNMAGIVAEAMEIINGGMKVWLSWLYTLSLFGITKNQLIYQKGLTAKF